MPLVQINVIENELTTEQKEKLITKMTEAVTSVISEKLRDVTWVVVNEVPSGNWGIGGHAIGLDDVKKMMAS
jgi:4-oxalocrotonate tautomerase